MPVLVILRGRDLPGRRFAHSPSDSYDNVYVALQVRAEPVGLVAGDADSAEWRTDVDVVHRDGGRDFRGPAVHGQAGARFLYLTWGVVDGTTFGMFRRAKLMLDEAPTDMAPDQTLVATVALTDEKGMPRCARVRAPHIRWSVE